VGADLEIISLDIMSFQYILLYVSMQAIVSMLKG